MIERGGIDDVAALRELWLELHHHHQQIALMPAEFVDDERSWAARSELYTQWLADDDSFLLLAREEEGLLGYALVKVADPDNEVLDTWDVSGRIAELETLLVSERARGQGLGSRLMDAVDVELERLDIGQYLVGLIPGNDGAQRFYERRGFKPRWLLMARDDTVE